MKMLSDYNLQMFGYFQPVIQENPIIIEYFTSNCLSCDLEPLSSDLLEDEKARTSFFKGIKENLKTASKPLLLPKSFLKYIDDEDLALSQLKSCFHEVRFGELNETFRFDKAFVYKYIKLVNSISTEPFNFSSKLLYSLNKDELSDEDLMYEILLTYDLAQTHSLVSEKVLTEKLCIAKMGMKEAGFQLQAFPEDIQIKVIFKNPTWFEFSSITRYSKKREKLFFFLAKNYPNKVTFMSSYNRDFAYELIKTNPEAYNYLDFVCQLDKKLIEYIADKTFVLNHLPGKSVYNCKRHPINNKDFVLKQFELVPEEEKAYLLSYIPIATKRIDNFSLLDDEEVICAAINKDYQNISYLNKSSIIWSNKNVAKLVVVHDISYFNSFKSSVKRDVDTVKYIYNSLPDSVKKTFFEGLTKTMQKKL